MSFVHIVESIVSEAWNEDIRDHRTILYGIQNRIMLQLMAVAAGGFINTLLSPSS